MQKKPGRTIHQPQPVTGTRTNPSERLMKQAQAEKTASVRLDQKQDAKTGRGRNGTGVDTPA